MTKYPKIINLNVSIIQIIDIYLNILKTNSCFKMLK